MNFSDSLLIAVPVDAVWQRLMDDKALHGAIPGCRSLRKRKDGCLEAQIRVSLAWMKRDVKVAVRRDVKEAGKALVMIGTRGDAQTGALAISLTPEGDGCRLGYTFSANLGGKAAVLGGALLGRTSRRMVQETLLRLAQPTV